MRRNVPMKATLSRMLFTATALVLGSLSVARAQIPQTACGNLSTELYVPNASVAVGTTYADFTSLPIVVGGSANSCLLVTISGIATGVNQAQPPAVATILVRVLLDGTKIAANTIGPGSVAYVWGTTTTYIFAFANVPPGSHVLHIQGAASGFAPNESAIDDVAVIVSHM
jgi:hypothetical protein